MKILIVDDDIGTLNAMRAGLLSFGFSVETAADGYSALKYITTSLHEGSPVDLVVSDLKMPGMNGLELLRAIRQLYPDLAYILMTAFGSGDLWDELSAFRCCAYLEKPFRPERLLELIHKLVHTESTGQRADESLSSRILTKHR